MTGTAPLTLLREMSFAPPQRHSVLSVSIGSFIGSLLLDRAGDGGAAIKTAGRYVRQRLLSRGPRSAIQSHDDGDARPCMSQTVFRAKA